MDRRKFLKWLGIGAVAAPVAAKVAAEAVPADFNTATMVYKCRELAPALGNGVALVSRAHPMSAAKFRETLEPMLNKVFDDVYSRHSTEWEQIFKPESLEDIKISMKSAALYQTKCKDWLFGHG